MQIEHVSRSESSVVTTQTTILGSWKEIASYLSQSVRTVQRWEWYLGLPVHRPHGQTRSRVVAFAKELDEWLAATPRRRQEHAALAVELAELKTKMAQLEAENTKLKSLVEKKQVGSDVAA